MSTATRPYYAVHSYMGLDYTIDSPCYVAYQFADKTSRDAWVADNEYSDGQYVARAATKAEAYKVAGVNSAHKYAALERGGDGRAQKITAAWR